MKASPWRTGSESSSRSSKDAREAPKEEGTGLGLTLCRRIVTLLGGRIWLESELGRGSAFHVAVPLGVPAETVDADATDSAEGRRSVVVIIDDDRSSLDLLSAYLTGTGLRVVRARRRGRGPFRDPPTAPGRGGT